ncbi:hypothetical protein [Acidiphilium sp. PM]|uniref:hypothetical protein n=1 Tax=Acidiphilium sp. PM TaxID=1043206 RepID=UPI0002144C79|nr:hypothetical protein [Acidiphilium sp. PM]EGO96798.1 hypothetical protein APM_0300 [Acidiphilium sp. PM]
MTDAEIAELRRVAESPLVRPSERIEARRKLVEMGAIPGRRLFGDDKRRALYAAREMLREMGFE